MKVWAWLSACGIGLSLVACGGVDQSPLLDDSGTPGSDASVTQDSGPGDDATTKDVVVLDAPPIEDVVTVDVPIGPQDSRIQCGTVLTCSAQNEVCCHHTQSLTQWECVTDASQCNSFGDVALSCSGHENCVSQGVESDICCADTSDNGNCTVATAVSCQSTCDGNSGQFQVGCSTNDPCQSGTCHASTCSLPGYNICY